MKISDSIMGYLKWAGLIAVLLNFFLLGHAYYSSNQAEKWVKTVEGTYIEESWNGDGFLVQWSKSPAPPSCPVTIHGVFQNNGYSVSDFGITLSPADHHAVHLAKNGKISIEPVGETAFRFVTDRPGEWHYKLEFTFHCSAVGKSQWFFWLNLDNTYTAKPVIIKIGGNDDDTV